MEGKETRFGIANSVLWSAATTAASNGSVNSMHDSYTPLGGLVPLFLMQFGEVVFGGVGSGLYGMIVFAIIAVFVAGLMVGRTPEYLGKKIEPYEMKMAALLILIMPMVVLGMTALAVGLTAGTSSVSNPGAHGFSEILYAYTSQGNNNGSAFAGLNANTPFYNITGGIAMLISRFLARDSNTRIGRCLGAKESRSCRSWHTAHSYAFVRSIPNGRRHLGRRPDVRAGDGTRPGRRTLTDDQMKGRKQAGDTEMATDTSQLRGRSLFEGAIVRQAISIRSESSILGIRSGIR